MRELASSSGIWNYVEPASLTPTWVHFDERARVAGYPVVRQGTRGVYVCVLQDALNTLRLPNRWIRWSFWFSNK